MTCSVKTPRTTFLFETWMEAPAAPVWINVYNIAIRGWPRASREDAELLADTDNPPLYRIKITPKVKP